jgi:DNA-binding GntR family transcriptional regulator
MNLRAVPSHQAPTDRYSTFSHIVSEHVREYIISGKLKPGEKINQSQLTQELGVSLIPLREAFKQLQAEGYITIIPHRGAFVKGLSLEEVEDLYMIRAELEELAADLAADRLTKNDLKTLGSLFRQMRNATRDRNYPALMTLNRKFHFKVYNACGRKHLLEILSDLWDRSERYRNLQTFDLVLDEQELYEHQEILEACQKGDRERLKKAIRFNVEQSQRNLEKLTLS